MIFSKKTFGEAILVHKTRLFHNVDINIIQKFTKNISRLIFFTYAYAFPYQKRKRMRKRREAPRFFRNPDPSNQPGVYIFF